MEYKGYETYHHKHKHVFGLKTFVFLTFVFVLGIIYFSANGNIGLGMTGKVTDIFNSNQNNNTININTSLSAPNVSLKGEYQEIILIVNQGSYINFGDKKISLEEPENKIIIKNFKGNIDINEIQIGKLKGTVSEITINNIPINLQKGGKIEFSISPDTKYSLFEIKNGVNIKELTFITSGVVYFEKDSLNLLSEKISFINFLGGFKIENKKLILNGTVQNLILDGEFRKLTLSSA